MKDQRHHGVGEPSIIGTQHAKRLYLLRHAKSSWDKPGLDDHDRPLAPRGRRAAKDMARHLERSGIAPQLVLCSGSRRTRETLERIVTSLGDSVDLRIRSELYAASPADLLKVLRELPDDVESVMVIAHNPGIQDLALSLARAGPEIARVQRKFPTAALATLEFDGSWRGLEPGAAELTSFVKPKDLPDGGIRGL